MRFFEKRKINFPQTGVINPSKISITPVADTLYIQKQQTPHTVYKIPTKKEKIATFDNFCSLIIVLTGVFTFRKIFKK